MPYTTGSSNLPSNVKKMPAAKKKAWVATWNAVHKSCMAGGGDNATCETKAFKVANGNAKKSQVGEMPDKSTFTELVRSVVGFVFGRDEQGPEATKLRSIGMRRMWDQLWAALDEQRASTEEWAWPVDIYLGDNAEVFAILTKGGQLYQVALDFGKDPLELGDWVQVKEEFTPISQSSVKVFRQKDGRKRWLFIAATTVLNRVAEIDAASLFDSFIAHAEQTQDYPRLDFYHMGSQNPKVWEFGTADYLARDGVCYIASGLFDEGSLLGQAVYKAVQNAPERWGCSPEFHAIGEPELIRVEPEVRIPVYAEGVNIRISVVLEKDAAGWFTGSGTVKEVERSMNKAIVKKLQELFKDADEEEALDAFVESVDGTNERVTQDQLIHRTQGSPQDGGGEDGGDGEDTDEDSEGGGDEGLEEPVVTATLEEIISSDFELDEVAIETIVQGILIHPKFREMVKPILEAVSAIQEVEGTFSEVAQLMVELDERVVELEKDDETKQREWSSDLPAAKAVKITYRPRIQASESEDGEDGYSEDDYGLLSSDEIAERTLSELPKY